MELSFESESITVQIYLCHYHRLANSETFWAAVFEKTRTMVSLGNFDGKLKITILLFLNSVISPVKRPLRPS